MSLLSFAHDTRHFNRFQAWPGRARRGNVWSNRRIVVTIRTNAAACLLGIAAIIKVLI